jgi:hypothetical protein
LCGGGAKLLALALCAAFSISSAHAGDYFVRKNPQSVQSSEREFENFQALRDRAVASGKVSVDVGLILPPGTEQIETPVEMAARQAAIIAEVAAFQSRYGANIVGGVSHGILTPMLSAEFTAAGVDQLLEDVKVAEFSAEGRYQGQLNAIYNNLSVQALPLPNGPIAGRAVAILDSGVQTRPNGASGLNDFQNRVVRQACFSEPFTGSGRSHWQSMHQQWHSHS